MIYHSGGGHEKKKKRNTSETKMRRVNGFVARVVSWMENIDVDEGTWLDSDMPRQRLVPILANDLFLAVGTARNG